jgi:hypothetical protein
MFDNITVNRNSDVIIQEDTGNQPYVAKVWQFDSSSGELIQIAQHDPRFFDPAYAGADKNFLTQDEESSGVIDLSAILGPGHYLADVQAHYPINAAKPHGFANPDELVEGGQLLVINTNAARATLDGGVLNVTGTVNDDDIAITRRGQSVSVSVGGNTIGTFSNKAIGWIKVSGFAGDDTLAVSSSIGAPVTFNGGAGEDDVLGRHRRSILEDGE